MPGKTGKKEVIRKINSAVFETNAKANLVDASMISIRFL
jgi:hypothetical protein